MSTTFKIVLVAIVCLLNQQCEAAGLLSPIKDLLQFNLFGIPVLHQTTSWPFKPEEAAQRSRLYQEVNGRLGEKAIERLGLGIDGKDQQRLAHQQVRDNGHLGGLNYYLP